MMSSFKIIALFFLLYYVGLHLSDAHVQKRNVPSPVELCKKDKCNSKTNFTITIFTLLIGEFYSGLSILANIGYVGGSYDIFQGNPQTIGELDPGFLSAQNIFEFTYNDQQTTTDGAYLIPDGTTVNSVESCSFSFASSVTRNSQSYSNSLKVHVDAKFKYYGASFSASSDYQHIDQSTSSGE